jgi:Ran GTPase-activating protein (RanGAP) involved in mRNA processing and transport
LKGNRIGREGAFGRGQRLAINDRLVKLDLSYCFLGIASLTNYLLSMGETGNYSALTDINLAGNKIQGAEGGRLVVWFLQRFQALLVLNLRCNRLGPLGACALAPGLTLPNLGLERLNLRDCSLGTDGVANLIPDGQINSSSTHLDLERDTVLAKDRPVYWENILALAARCTNLDRLEADHPNSYYPTNPTNAAG